jgi:hypothetical protein
MYFGFRDIALNRALRVAQAADEYRVVGVTVQCGAERLRRLRSLTQP